MYNVSNDGYNIMQLSVMMGNECKDYQYVNLALVAIAHCKSCCINLILSAHQSVNTCRGFASTLVHI